MPKRSHRTNTSLANVNLIVADAERSARFYVDTIGLNMSEELSEPPSFFYLNSGACSLTLQTATDIGQQAVSRSIELGFKVDDVAAAQSLLAQAGVELGTEQQMGWGSALEARDPDGNRLNIFKMRE